MNKSITLANEDWNIIYYEFKNIMTSFVPDMDEEQYKEHLQFYNQRLEILNKLGKKLGKSKLDYELNFADYNIINN